MKKLALENRIALLKSRNKDNARIISKLERRLRMLDVAETNTQQND